MLKRIAYLGLLAIMANLLFGSLAFAVTDDSEDISLNEYFDENAEVLDVSDGTEGDTEDDSDIEDDVTSEEDSSNTDEVDGEDTNSENTSLDALAEVGDDVAEDIQEFWNDPELTDVIYTTVRWGYFGDNRGENTEYIDSDGIVHFSGDAVGIPGRTIRWEYPSDKIIWGKATRRNTVWQSLIVGYNDGLLFKIKYNPESTGDNEAILKYTNDYINSTIEFPLEDLMNTDERKMTFEFDGGYWVVFHAWTQDEWVEMAAEHFDVDTDVANDYIENAWYVRYMNLVVNKGFFSGYKNADGTPTGKIGPSDTVTRFQTLKVLMELAYKLDLGIGAMGCDPDTVDLTDEVDWMGSHWANGYVQCAYNSDLDISLLEGVIKDDLTEGIKPAERAEVIVTAFELLDLEVDGTPLSEFDDVDYNDIGEEFKDMINNAADWGIISGYPDGTFKPHKHVLRAEMFKIVSLFYNYLSI